MLKIPTFVLGGLLILTGLIGYLFQAPSLSIVIKGRLADDTKLVFSDGTQTQTVKTEYLNEIESASFQAKEIIEGRADRGIVVCGSGVGVSVAANKIPGIRAAVCHDTYSAHQGVEHDDMNVLCIGGRIIGSELAFEIIDSFLQARYVPQDRHARRLAKVLQIEQHGLATPD